MTALGPYSQKTDYKFSYDLSNPYRNDQSTCYEPNSFKFIVGSISDILDKTPELSIFNYIVNVAGLREQFNTYPSYGNYNQTFTLIVPVNNGIVGNNLSEDISTNLDIGNAKRIINSSTLSRSIPISTLSEGNSKTYYMLPYDYSRRAQDSVDRIKTDIFMGPVVYFNNSSRVIGEIKAINGIILLVDKPIVNI